MKESNLKCIDINQSETSIYSLLRKVSDYFDNLNLVSEMPFKSDDKSGKVGRTFPDFDF